MNIQLLEFQRRAIRELNDAIESGKRNIIFKSCTGSGKTIMLTSLMSDYLKCHDKTVFMWFTPGNGNLEEQSKAKMDKYFHNAQTKLLSDVMTGGFCDGDCCFINWELLNKSKNNARKEGEQTNFDEFVVRALDEGIRFIIIIDEGHRNNNEKSKSKDIIALFPNITIIRASATPSDYDKRTSTLIEVSEADVIEQGLIKKLLVINEGFCQLADTIIEDEIDFLMSKALMKQQDLRSEYLRLGVNVNPLIIVQMPNKSDAQLCEVQKWFANKGITVENEQFAIWLDKMKENIEGITDNNAPQNVVVCKMAITTGWDCPRAQILVKLRENTDEKFEIQTIGRIRRMPEARHYGNDMLDNCYLFTFDENFTEGVKSALGKGAYEAKILDLKSEYKQFSLTSEQQPDILNENDPIIALKTLSFHLKGKYHLTDDCTRNKNLLENNEFVFSDNIENTTKYGKVHSTNEFDNLDSVSFSIPLNTHIHGRDFHHEISEIGRVVSLGYEKTNTIIRRLFCRNIKTSNNIKKLLKLEVRQLYAFVINNAERLKDEFREAMSEQMNFLDLKDMDKKDVPFHIPHRYLFTYDGNAVSQKPYTKNVYVGYLSSAEIRSNGERRFEEFCEESDFVKWFYKNGDKGVEFYSILYKDNNGKVHSFYPDYVVGTIDDTIWIIETKGGEGKDGESQDIDKFSPKKFAALKEYVTKQQDMGCHICGGFVRLDKQQNLCICTSDKDFNENITRPNWELLEELFKQ